MTRSYNDWSTYENFDTGATFTNPIRSETLSQTSKKYSEFC